MIPKKVITAMRIAINKTNFLPILTKMKFDKKENAFVGTDSLLLVEYRPNEVIPSEDFFIEYNSIRAIEKMLGTDPEAYATIRGNIKADNDRNLVAVIAGNANVYFDVAPTESEKYPDYMQAGLFEKKEGTSTEIMLNSSMKKLHRIVSVIGGPGSVAEVKEKTYLFEYEDNFGKYRVVLRRHTESGQE